MMNEPLISCLCLTMPGREQFFRQAVDCWKAQTYSQKQFLTITEDFLNSAIDSALFQQTLAWANLDGAHGVALSINGGGLFTDRLLDGWGTLGKKRNVACASTNAEYIAIWDDDDYYAPQRLVVQLAHLQRTGKAVTAFRQVPFVMPNGEWYLHPPGPTAEVSGLGVGSSLFFRRDWWEKHPFRNTSLGEDADFARVAHNAGELVLTPETDLMYVRRHNGNTWKVDPAAAGWQRIEQPEFVVEIDGRSI